MTGPAARAAAAALALLAAVLAGCAGSGTGTEEAVVAAVQEQPQAPPQETTLTLPRSNYSAQFTQAETALAGFDWMQASVALAAIPHASMSADDRVYHEYLQARIDFARGQQDTALERMQMLQLQPLHPALQYRILSFQLHMLELRQHTLAAAQTADQLLRMAPASGRDGWRRSVWLNLQRTPDTALHEALGETQDLQWYGWLDLALISRQDRNAFVAAIPTWRERHRDHPAAQPLPGGLDYLLAPAPGSGTTALLLPLSGRLAPAGKAVLDGYLAAWYAARAAGETVPGIVVLDEAGYTSAPTAYADAVSRGASLVVGPLHKESVADIATLPERATPILALNRIDNAPPATGAALVQFSLAPEDEARRLAELAFGHGARNAMVLTPQGDWGRKVDSALRQRWNELGGRIVADAVYADPEEYSDGIKAALGVTGSEERARAVRDMLANNIEFTPRRRQDTDVVFLLSRDGNEARSLKPLLAFHYAGGIPVYALSSIYSGVPDRRDRDLNGIRLVEMPWLLGANPALRVAIASGDNGSGAYTRLNALGADAFLLQQRFGSLRAGADALVPGNTGLLTMDPQLRIHREMPLATFDGDTLVPLSLE